jgi:5-formyltetrahydrofolate cyclo-ligase
VVAVLSRNAKANLRAAMREVRRAVARDPVERARRSRVIAERVIGALSSPTANDGRPVRRIMVFEAMAGEPDLSVLVGWADGRGIEVFVPAVDGDDLRVMPHDADPRVLDAVIVPGLAFTREGHRLGQGGGHFDRFLPRLSAGCLRIGVAFDEQLVDALPLESHDVTLDMVVTDG